jgi:hypothetical protein
MPIRSLHHIPMEFRIQDIIQEYTANYSPTVKPVNRIQIYFHSGGEEGKKKKKNISKRYKPY